MLLGTTQKLSKLNAQFSLSLDGTPIEHVNSHKLLGFHIDSSLTFKSHVSNLISRLNSLRIASSNNLPSHVLNLLYFSLLHPHIIYCLEIYSSCSDSSLINKVESKRKAAARLICKADRMHPSAPLFRYLKWPTISELISQRLTQYLCLSKSPFGPSYLPNFEASSHSYSTRFISSHSLQRISVVYQNATHTKPQPFRFGTAKQKV